MKNDAGCDKQHIAEYATKLKAIGHPIRLEILCLIARNESHCVSKLWQCLGQPQPVVSQHLAILKQSNVVKAETQKTKRVYSIIDEFVLAIVNDIEQRRKDSE